MSLPQQGRRRCSAAPGAFFIRSDEIERHVDIAARCLGVRADLVRCVDQFLCDISVDALQADVEPRAQKIGSAVGVQIDFRVDLGLDGQLDLSLGCSELDGANETSRPCGAKKAFGSRVRLRQAKIQLAIAAACETVATTLVMGLAGKRSFSVMVKSFRVSFSLSSALIGYDLNMLLERCRQYHCDLIGCDLYREKRKATE